MLIECIFINLNILTLHTTVLSLMLVSLICWYYFEISDKVFESLSECDHLTGNEITVTDY